MKLGGAPRRKDEKAFFCFLEWGWLIFVLSFFMQCENLDN